MLLHRRVTPSIKFAGSHLYLGGEPGGYSTKFNTGRLHSKVQPLTLSYTILAEKVPLYIYFIEKRYPFHIPSLRSLALIFM